MPIIVTADYVREQTRVADARVQTMDKAATGKGVKNWNEFVYQWSLFRNKVYEESIGFDFASWGSTWDLLQTWIKQIAAWEEYFKKQKLVDTTTPATVPQQQTEEKSTQGLLGGVEGGLRMLAGAIAGGAAVWTAIKLLEVINKKRKR